MKNARLIGIVLCGGKSKRMGNDKALLNYHDQPQVYHLTNLMSDICEKVVVSANLPLSQHLSSDCYSIADAPEFANHGPLSGLLSVAQEFPGSNFLVVGCDYPFLQKKDLEQLTNHFKGIQSCGILNPETNEIEPLICLYSAADISALAVELKSGNDSLRRFLIKRDAMKVASSTSKAYLSVDTPYEYQKIISAS